MEGYRIPTIPMASHDPARWEYGRPWIQALNSGDPTGAAYLSTAVPLMRPNDDARSAVRGRLGGCSSGSTPRLRSPIRSPRMAGHQVALRPVATHARLQGAVQALEGDVLNGLLRYHEMTAILDKIAAGELLGRRQDMAVKPAPVPRAGAAAGPQQAAARHRSLDHQHAAHELARRAPPRTMRSSPALATRCGPGGSHDAITEPRVLARRAGAHRRCRSGCRRGRRCLCAAHRLRPRRDGSRTPSPRSSRKSALRTQQEQHSQLRRMAQRLSMFTNLAKYSLPDAPTVAHPRLREP